MTLVTQDFFQRQPHIYMLLSYDIYHEHEIIYIMKLDRNTYLNEKLYATFSWSGRKCLKKR